MPPSLPSAGQAGAWPTQVTAEKTEARRPSLPKVSQPIRSSAVTQLQSVPIALQAVTEHTGLFGYVLCSISRSTPAALRPGAGRYLPRTGRNQRTIGNRRDWLTHGGCRSVHAQTQPTQNPRAWRGDCRGGKERGVPRNPRHLQPPLPWGPAGKGSLPRLQSQNIATSAGHRGRIPPPSSRGPT